MAQRPQRARGGLWYAGAPAALKMYALVHVFALPTGAALAVIGGLMFHISVVLITGICVGAVGVVDSIVVYPALNAWRARRRAVAGEGATPPTDPRPST